ncbi:hypothetical protein EIP91_002136 [Steccherinum ochraceum]|uniref:Uncharacterized protein n=1 Tax=Steccherinum ochraceum TaxID=92696 RepID=A0A4R0RTJ2_9APHY|nr:hypothetical protein EIP91_002136 [Steccherinum ochraceum]
MATSPPTHEADLLEVTETHPLTPPTPPSASPSERSVYDFEAETDSSASSKSKRILKRKPAQKSPPRSPPRDPTDTLDTIRNNSLYTYEYRTEADSQLVRASILLVGRDGDHTFLDENIVVRAILERPGMATMELLPLLFPSPQKHRGVLVSIDAGTRQEMDHSAESMLRFSESVREVVVRTCGLRMSTSKAESRPRRDTNLE